MFGKVTGKAESEVVFAFVELVVHGSRRNVINSLTILRALTCFVRKKVDIRETLNILGRSVGSSVPKG